MYIPQNINIDLVMFILRVVTIAICVSLLPWQCCSLSFFPYEFQHTRSNYPAPSLYTLLTAVTLATCGLKMQWYRTHVPFQGPYECALVAMFWWFIVVFGGVCVLVVSWWCSVMLGSGAIMVYCCAGGCMECSGEMMMHCSVKWCVGWCTWCSGVPVWRMYEL